MKRTTCAALSVAMSLSAVGPAIAQVCDRGYWPFSEFIEAPSSFQILLKEFPDDTRVTELVSAHHRRVEVEFRQPEGPCNPSGIARFLDNTFGSIFNTSEEDRYRANNGIYREFATSCRIVNWERVRGGVAQMPGSSPHVLRYGTASDAMCGENAMFMTIGNGLIAVDLEGESCDITDFSAQNVRGISLSSIFSAVFTSEAIAERLYEYIGKGDQLSLPPYGPPTAVHQERAYEVVPGSQPIFPTILPGMATVLPFGRSYDDRYFLIYPTFNNTRGDANRYFPTFSSSLRIDIVEVTDEERRRRVFRDSCLDQRNNTDQPILNFR